MARVTLMLNARRQAMDGMIEGCGPPFPKLESIALHGIQYDPMTGVLLHPDIILFAK